MKKAIPYGLGIRAKRICSSDASYRQERESIKTHLKNRGYKDATIEQSLTKTDNLDRDDLLEYKEKKNNDRVPLVVTYSHNLPDLHQITRQRMNILNRSTRLKEIYKEPPLISYRRDKNLMDILVHSKHKKIFCPRKTSKCERCAVCKYLTDDEALIQNGCQYNFRTGNCKMNNAVYGVFCEECDKIVYVGETGTTLYERIQNHLSSVRKNLKQPVPSHFNSPDHKMEDMKFVILETIKTKDIHLRKIRESFWIKKLQTLTPEGLNQNAGVGDSHRSATDN